MSTERGRPALALLLSTVLLPLALLALGLWQAPRAVDDLAEAENREARMGKAVSLMEARIAPGGTPDMRMQYRRNGRLYAGPLALAEAREDLEDAQRAITVSRIRGWLPPVVAGSGALVAALSALALLGAVALGRAGRLSRDALLRGFSVVRHLLPPLLGAQVLLLAVGIVAAVSFESLAIVEVGDFSSGGIKLLMIAAVVAVFSLVTAGKALLQLRRAMGLFAPDPLEVQGRAVTPAEAPGLWRMIDDLATRLGALKPDQVVVGLTGGFHVSSGAKLLQPGNIETSARMLYLPLPYLPLLRQDEVAAIIGHELAHFSGGDTEYSLRFVPIYAGVGRSLEAVALAGIGQAGGPSLLIRPALQLGVFVLDQFHHAVRHWSRLREFAADAAGAGVTSTEAASRALLRTTAAHRGIEAVLEAAYGTPASAPPDLVAAVLEHAAEQGLADPAPHLEEEVPHPTDTHPPTRQRIAALGSDLPTLLAGAALPPEPDAAARLAGYFADPAGLCRRATEDFMELAQAQARDTHAAVQAAAEGVAAGPLPLQANHRPLAIALVVIGLVFGLCGVALVLLGFQGVEPGFARAMGAVCLLGGAATGAAGLWRLWRRQEPFLVLRPEDVQVTGLEQPIRWDDIADLDVSLQRGAVVMRMLLVAGTAAPVRKGKARNVVLDGRRRIVTVTANLPRGMKAQDFADLIGRYRAAAAARRWLAEQTAA